MDDLVRREREEDDERLYSISDTLSVTAITNHTGEVLERYAYSAFGVCNVLDPDFAGRGASEWRWETRFARYRWDENTALYQVRYRYLNAGLGRWLTEDPRASQMAEPLAFTFIDQLRAEFSNLYAYLSNQPFSATDPFGLGCCDNEWNAVEAAEKILDADLRARSYAVKRFNDAQSSFTKAVYACAAAMVAAAGVCVATFGWGCAIAVAVAAAVCYSVKMTADTLRDATADLKAAEREVDKANEQYKQASDAYDACMEAAAKKARTA
jgi:RHS repeat-associated protein